LTYTVQVSTDLQTWTTSGVTLQTSGTTVTASYPLAGTQRAFLRIVVSLRQLGPRQRSTRALPLRGVFCHAGGL